MRTGGRVLVGLASLAFLMPRPATAQAGAVLADADLLIRGVRLTVAPARQEVDPGRPTVVRTSLGDVAPAQLVPGVLVAADLSGPGLDAPLALTTAPGEPFAIPGLNREGAYALTGIRLVAGGRTLLQADPDRVEILVHRLVVSSVTSRPLTAAEIARAGIVIADDSFRVYRYTVGFATVSGTVEVGFDLVAGPDGRVLLPSSPDGRFALPAGAPGAAPVPQVQAFSLPIPGGGGEPNPPPGSAPGRAIPGFLVIPGDLAFLHQFFSVILVVQNGALAGSGLTLRDLHARLELDGDGLRQAETAPPTVPGQPVPLLDPGPDGLLGTADDLTFLVAQASGQASWLVEGLEEGSHVVRVALQATIDGLASGAPATVAGAVPGVVVVRDPRFALTFFHPQTVRAGESYEHRVVVSNLSTTPVYRLGMSLPATQLTGARLADGEPAQHEIAELLPRGAEAIG